MAVVEQARVAASSPEIVPERRFWLSDFAWRDGALWIRKTHIRLALTWPVVAEILSWTVWLAILNLAALRARLTAAPRLKLWFTPDLPRAWYLLGGAAIWAGLDTARQPEDAGAVFYFDDSTTGDAPATITPKRFNFACTDISKSHVARVFEEVFGYPFTVDPTRERGEIIEKPEKNGVHGGQIVMAPHIPRPGFTYQRVVDTQGTDGCCRDLRTPTCGGEPVVVWIKTKTPEGRFSINNRKAELAEPRDVYSPEELRRIKVFCIRMGLDWGGLDILRDVHSGRIYIVDVNKTDLGPVIALSWRDKIVSMERLARALRRLVEAT